MAAPLGGDEVHKTVKFERGTHFHLHSRIKGAPYGRTVLRALYAAYESAGRGVRVALPFEPAEAGRLPVEGWLGALTR